jgi:hypothetical protein
MGFAEGVVWSLLGAVAHTVIDVLRKFGAQRLPPAGGVRLLHRCCTAKLVCKPGTTVMQCCKPCCLSAWARLLYARA